MNTQVLNVLISGVNYFAVANLVVAIDLTLRLMLLMGIAQGVVCKHRTLITSLVAIDLTLVWVRKLSAGPNLDVPIPHVRFARHDADHN